jgi:hypothetical protein
MHPKQKGRKIEDILICLYRKFRARNVIFADVAYRKIFIITYTERDNMCIFERICHIVVTRIDHLYL